MTDSQALDGNAIAGTLAEVFGGDMTTVIGVCAHCGARGPVAEVVVYTRAPGVVMRCRACNGLLMVITEVRGAFCVDALGLVELGAPA
jgi:Family of unknown function (DUF6510)